MATPKEFADMFLALPGTGLDTDAIISAGRRMGKTEMGRVMEEFLSTPGYSTGDVTKFGGHDAYMEHLRGTFEVADTIDSRVEEIKLILNDPNNSWQFMLNQPQSLTVERSAQFRKDSFIGGELLHLKDVYLGKRDGLIGRFIEDKSGLVTGAAGAVIEIPFTKAESILDGFGSFLSYVKNPPADPEKVAEETEMVAAKRLEENPVYGSW